MTSTYHSIFWMGIYLATVVAVGVLLMVPLEIAFMANIGFNSLIVGVLLIGVAINLRQVQRLNTEVNWIKVFRTGQVGLSVTTEPRLLKPLAKHLSGLRKDRFRLSALSLRTVLDGIRERLDEAREISRYLIGTLIFLGLLGTFWGLLGTIDAVGQVINGLEVGSKDFSAVFTDLKAGLQAPLSGMGTAFSSSLFGLGGSLVLGFLDIQAGHAQNRFFNGLEEWLSGVTQLIDQPGLPATDEEVLDGELPVTSSNLLGVLIEEIRAERLLLRALLEQQNGSATHRPEGAPQDSEPAN